ncbi:hypothetical protein LTR04_002316, partial [Oleoguttula sp. CCFEE 6159]
PIVRINPFEVHVKDPDWYDELYTGSSRRRDKSAWFLEPIIQDKANKLCDAMKGYVESGKPVELQTAYMALTLDVISHYAFGESFGLTEKPGFSPEWKKVLLATIEAGIMNRHLPWVADILMSLPDSVAAAVSAPVAFFLQIQRVKNIFRQGLDVRKQVETVLARKRDLSSEKMHKTIFEELRDSNLPPQEKTIERLMDEGFILIGAGGETTAQTLAVLTYHLLNNPPILKKLRAELIEAMPEPDTPVSWQKLEQLPYLRAIMTECHRVQAVITTRLIRIAPNEVLKFREWEIPAGTPTSMTTHFMHLDPELFPEPYRFDPDRWIRAAERGERLEKYVVPFSKGSRACIGLHLANAELYLGIAHMIRRFDFELYETRSEDIEITWDGFAGGFRPESKGIRVRVLGERT